MPYLAAGRRFSEYEIRDRLETCRIFNGTGTWGVVAALSRAQDRKLGMWLTGDSVRERRQRLDGDEITSSLKDVT